MEIRPEEDVPGIRDVNRRAFGREREAWPVDEPRGKRPAKLSPAAAEDGRITGRGTAVLPEHPGYYPPFVLSANLATNLSSPYAGEAFMALEPVPGALAGVSGGFAFAPPFGAVS